MNIYTERIGKLRKYMAQKGLDAVVISGTDPHSSEYPAPRWQQVRWISGFTGEAGDVVVTADHAGLWTDTRYFIQANEQLEGTGIELHKTRVPSEVLIPDWLAAEFAGRIVSIGIDGLCQSVSAKHQIESSIASACEPESAVVDIPDMLDDLWDDRPAIPATPVTELSDKFTGCSRADKISWFRSEMAARGCDCALLSALDEIAWLLNVRAEDIDYNPYVISYLFVSRKNVLWFVRDSSSVPNLEGVQSCAYETVADCINDAASGTGRIMIDTDTLNCHLYGQIEKSFGESRIVMCQSPVILKKAVKNHTEIEGFRKAFIEDGLAMERFLFWLEKKVADGEEISEWDASVKLTSLRASIDGYHGNSFENISAYGKNAALPHYSTPVKNSAVIRKKGLYLTDSGGQYDYGTTDITRTVPVGRCNRQEKEDYTLVLKGMIDLSQAIFPKGTAGCQIDALAREPLWKAHRNFGHGTGHGIGFYLGVHEGPQSIRQNFLKQPLLPGMVTSNEPGLYREGRHGIRHENIVLCTEDGSDEFGEWLKFETLTCCHIDTAPILKKHLSKEELKWLNRYNRLVYKTLAPRLEPEQASWLKKKCKKIKKGWF